MMGRSSGDTRPGAPFDRVELLEENGEKRVLDREQFQALKLDERVRYILKKRLTFFLRGKEVPLKEALAG
jgi:hypothetical protein